jgi:hypothetical protein
LSKLVLGPTYDSPAGPAAPAEEYALVHVELEGPSTSGQGASVWQWKGSGSYDTETFAAEVARLATNLPVYVRIEETQLTRLNGSLAAHGLSAARIPMTNLYVIQGIDSSRDRTTCEAIRGTPYRSAAEREFFFASCVEPPPVQTQDLGSR